MNKFLLIVFLTLSTHLFSQIDKHGNPFFNSVTLEELKVDDYQLNANYYTLSNNISNTNSSVFISQTPSLDQIEAAAIKLPSDFFLVIKDGSPIKMIVIAVKSTEKVFFTINPSDGSNEIYPCDLKGDISENRAKEIIEQKFDANARISGDKLFFNKKEFSIITNDEIKNKVKKLIKDKKLNEGNRSEIKIADKGLLKKAIIEQTKEGGKLDFFTEIKGHEMDGVQVKKGVFTTKSGIALYKWGRENYELGVNTSDDALKIWEEIKARKPNQRETDYIIMGFNKELEK